MPNNDMTYTNKLNEKEYNIGDVIFWVNPYTYKWDWGIVSEYYSDGYAADLYEHIDTRMIDGIPFKDYAFAGKRRKLPKGWSWDTKLFEVEYDELNDKIIKQYLDTKPNEYYSKENINKMIDDGIMVRPSTQLMGYYPSADVTKDGWNIQLEPKLSDIGYYGNRNDYAIVTSQHCYHTYEEAQQAIKAYEDELHRQAELSDYDWSVEQIDKALYRANWLDGDYILHCREFLLAQKNVEDIVVRTSSHGIQWKYDRNKKWMDIV